MSGVPQSQKKKDAGRIPGPAAVPSVIEIRLQFQLPNSKTVYSIVHGFFTTPPSSVQAIASGLFTSIGSAWSTNLASLMATTTLFQSVLCRDMTSPSNPVFVGTGTALAGTSVSPAMPENAAIVLTENVNQRGRGAKGRVYLGGWATNADAGGGAIATAAQTGLNAFGTALFNAITAVPLTPCVAQVARQTYLGVTGTTHPARSATHVNVNTYTCRDLIWDTQRRRVQP